MNQHELENKLMAVARADVPSDRVPYAFEKRIMARLQTLPGVDEWGTWAQALSKAAAFCLALMILMGAVSYFSGSAASSGTDLSQEFDNTVLAAAGQDQNSDSIW